MRLRVAALALAASGAALGLSPTGRPQLLGEERHDTSAPLWLLRLPEAPPPGEWEREPGRVVLSAVPAPERDPVLQESHRALFALPVGKSFDGIGEGFVGVPPAQRFDVGGINPPDPQGDVGINHYLQIVNSSIAVFSKTGEAVFGPVPTRTLFSGFGGPCEGSNAGDGIVLYDSLADRWLVTQAAVPSKDVGPFAQCIAVSRTPDPTGPYARYAYVYPSFNDYPKFGVWPDAYYASYNMFSSARDNAVLQSVRICAFDRARMHNGETALQLCVDLPAGEVSGTIPADFDGFLPPPQGAPGSILGFWRNDTLVVYRFHVNWEKPSESWLESMAVPVAPFGKPCENVRSGACIPQVGPSAGVLDALSDFMMFRVAYRNFGGYEALVANHTVTAGSSSGVRWYEIRDPAGDPYVYQQGTYGPDSSWRWLASAAMDRAGNIGVGFSVSAPDMHPGVGVTGHAITDPPGIMGQGESVFVGSGSQDALLKRWGDYSGISIDPSDDCTFWYTGEYIPLDGRFNWRTRVLTFQLPGCATAPDFAVWTSPVRKTLTRGGSTSIAVSTAALRETAAKKNLQLSVSLSPPGLSVVLSPPVVLAGETATLTVAADGSAGIGEAQFVVDAVSADGVVLSARGTVAVIDSDFTLSTDPTSIAVGVGATATIRLNTASLFGAPEVVLLSAPHVPRGITATINPPYVRLGETATVQLSGDGIFSAAQGFVRLRAAGILATHDVAVHVRTLVRPQVQLMLPLERAMVRGTIQVAANAVPSAGTTIARLDLMVDGSQMHGVTSDRSPAEMLWNTESVNDGPHLLRVRATDADGNQGSSDPVGVWIQNKNECGCSSDAGGWEALALFGLLAAIRRRGRR